MDIIILTVLVISAVLLVALLLRSFANKPQDQQEQQNTTAKTLQENAGLRKEIELTQSLLKDTETQRDNLQDELTVQKSKVSELETELKNERQNLTQRNDLEKLFVDQFENMSTKTLKNQQEQFKAETLKPISDEISDKVEKLNREWVNTSGALKREWVNTSGALEQQIKTLTNTNQTLSTALTKAHVIGQLGETKVETILKLSGLTKGIQYETQETKVDANQSKRPDFIVRMPDKLAIILDSKFPLSAIMEAERTTNEEQRKEILKNHAQNMQKHVDQLAAKKYPSSFPNAAKFVVMVVPESAFLPAVDLRPEIMEYALRKDVVITTHFTLFALLKIVELGWQQQKLDDNTKDLGILGSKLHDALRTFASHYANIGKTLNRAVEHYDSGVGSLENNVLVQARRFSELGVQTTKEIPETNSINKSTRPLKSSTTTNHQHTNNQHTTKTPHTPSTSNN